MNEKEEKHKMKKLCLFEEKHVDEACFGKTEVGTLKEWCNDCEEKYTLEVCESWSYTRNDKLYSSMENGDKYWRWCVKHKFYCDEFGSEEGCLICKFKEKRSKKWSLDEINNSLQQKGIKLESTEYTKTRDKLEYSCLNCETLLSDTWERVVLRGLSCSCLDQEVKKETQYRGYKTKYAKTRSHRTGSSTIFEHADLMKQWSVKNTKHPSEYSCSTKQKTWWKCLGDKDHPDYQVVTADKAIRNQGCPYCSGHRLSPENSLETKYPQLVKEWSLKNEKKPSEYSRCSESKVWWRCLANKGHPDYEMRIADKTYSEQGCPYCGGQKVCDENCLEERFPYIAKEWSSKNVNGPECYSYGSKKKVWFVCPKNKDHKDYKLSIEKRTRRGQGCPKCSFSRGENALDLIFKELKLEGDKEREWFQTKSGRKITEWDRALYMKNKKVIFEFDGEQHFKEVERFNKGKDDTFEQQQSRDNYKLLLCYKKGYYLCRIHHKDISRIQFHVETFLRLVERKDAFIYLSRARPYEQMMMRSKIPRSHFYVDPNCLLNEYLKEEGKNFDWTKYEIIN